MNLQLIFFLSSLQCTCKDLHLLEIPIGLGSSRGQRDTAENNGHAWTKVLASFAQGTQWTVDKGLSSARIGLHHSRSLGLVEAVPSAREH